MNVFQQFGLRVVSLLYIRYLVAGKGHFGLVSVTPTCTYFEVVFKYDGIVICSRVRWKRTPEYNRSGNASGNATITSNENRVVHIEYTNKAQPHIYVYMPVQYCLTSTRHFAKFYDINHTTSLCSCKYADTALEVRFGTNTSLSKCFARWHTGKYSASACSRKPNSE